MTKSPKDGKDRTLLELAELPNQKQAEKRMTEHAALYWHVKFGAELTAAKQSLEHVEARFVSCNNDLRTLEKRLSNTDVLIPAIERKSSKDGEPEPWTKFDLFLFWLAAGGAVTAAALGAGNLYANMMASMSPVFLETPALAMGLSMLLPLGSATLKYASDYFPTNKSRKLYELGVFLATAGALVTWAYLFAQTFPGVAAPMDFDAMLTGAQGGSALVLAQLAVELLAGSSLWIAASGIYRKYQPNTLDDNQQFIALEKVVKAQRAYVAELNEQYGASQGEFSRLEAQRDLYISERCIKLAALRRHI